MRRLFIIVLSLVTFVGCGERGMDGPRGAATTASSVSVSADSSRRVRLQELVAQVEPASPFQLNRINEMLRNGMHVASGYVLYATQPERGYFMAAQLGGKSGTGTTTSVWFITGSKTEPAKLWPVNSVATALSSDAKTRLENTLVRRSELEIMAVTQAARLHNS